MCPRTSTSPRWSIGHQDVHDGCDHVHAANLHRLWIPKRNQGLLASPSHRRSLPGGHGPARPVLHASGRHLHVPHRSGTGGWNNQALVTGLKIALDGTGIIGAGAARPRTSPTSAPACRAPPCLSWDPVPGANFYFVYYAQDEDFTTTEIPAVPLTFNTMFQLRLE